MKEYIVQVFNDHTEWRNSAEEFDRENGPAMEYANGDKEWYKEGKWHRENGPAVEYAGAKFWYKKENCIEKVVQL